VDPHERVPTYLIDRCLLQFHLRLELGHAPTPNPSQVPSTA
jgi:hypothetical protein